MLSNGLHVSMSLVLQKANKYQLSHILVFCLTSHLPFHYNQKTGG